MIQNRSDAPSPTAFHEAAHAVVGLVLGLPLMELAMPSLGRDAGCVFDGDGYGAAPPSALIPMLLAGAVAEQRAFPAVDLAWKARDDRERALTLINGVAHADGKGGHLPVSAPPSAAEVAWRDRASQAVDQHWPWIARVASRLEAVRRLTAADVIALRD